jgi:hypothetical protein
MRFAGEDGAGDLGDGGVEIAAREGWGGVAAVKWDGSTSISVTLEHWFGGTSPTEWWARGDLNSGPKGVGSDGSLRDPAAEQVLHRTHVPTRPRPIRSVASFWTTNFDSLIEDSIERAGRIANVRFTEEAAERSS